MIPIINSHFSGNNLLFEDIKHQLWIAGSNTFRKTGYGDPSQHHINPIKINLQLEENETATEFTSLLTFVVILTSKGNLYVSNRASKTNYNSYYHNISETDVRNLVSLVKYDPTATQTVTDTNTNYQEPIHLNLLANSQYNSLITSPVCRENLTKSQGFTLLAINVDDYVASMDTIMFRVGTVLNVFAYDMPTFNLPYVICTNPTKKMCYCQILTPVAFTNLTCIKEYECYHASHLEYQYVFHTCITNYIPVNLRLTMNSCVQVTFFKPGFEMKPSDIVINGDTINVFHSNIWYRYFSQTATLMPLALNPCKQLIKFNYGGRDNYCMNYDDGLYIGVDNNENKLTKRKHYHSLDSFAIEFNHMFHSIICVLIDKEDQQLVEEIDSHIYFNIRNITYEVSDWGLIYLKDGELFAFVEDVHQNNTALTRIKAVYKDPSPAPPSAKKLPTTNSCAIYKFNDAPKDITEIIITDNKLLGAKAVNKLYYFSFNTKSFKTESLVMVELIDKACQPVQPQLIDYNLERNMGHHRAGMSINVHFRESENKFDKMVCLLDSVDVNCEFNFYIKQGVSEVLASGVGIQRSVADEMIRYFADKYLIRHNSLTTFNELALKGVTDDWLVNVGRLLHSVILGRKAGLEYHLPLDVLECIKGDTSNMLTDSDLEYFLELEDPELFKNVKKMKDHTPDSFREILCDSELEFKTYSDLLKSKCFYHKTTYGENIAKGFLHKKEINRLIEMNFATLDYYITGDVLINRKELINAISVVVEKGAQANTELLVNPVLSEPDMQNAMSRFNNLTENASTNTLPQSSARSIEIGSATIDLTNGEITGNFDDISSKPVPKTTETKLPDLPDSKTDLEAKLKAKVAELTAKFNLSIPTAIMDVLWNKIMQNADSKELTDDKISNIMTTVESKLSDMLEGKMEHTELNKFVKLGTDFIKQKFDEIITNLPEAKLKILLRNWYGHSVFVPGTNYQVIITSDKTYADVHFSTCASTLKFKISFLNTSENIQKLIDNITTPVVLLQDFNGGPHNNYTVMEEHSLMGVQTAWNQPQNMFEGYDDDVIRTELVYD